MSPKEWQLDEKIEALIRKLVREGLSPEEYGRFLPLSADRSMRRRIVFPPRHRLRRHYVGRH
jgi:hypothetical protein